MTSRRELYAMGEPLGDSATREKPFGRIYGGGGGGGPTTSTTVQKAEIAPELRPLAQAYTNKAINLSNQGFTPYSGQRFEPVNQVQQAGVNRIVQRATQGSQTMNNAENSLNQFIQGGNTNPFLDQMVNKAQANVLSNANTAAIRSGSFGNSGIAEQAAKQMGDIATNMYGNAYSQDQANRMQAIGMAPTFGNAAYQDAGQLMNAGNFLQDQNQQVRDFNYQQFQEQQNLPYKQLAAMAGVFGSQPYGSSSSSSTSQSGGGGK